jgi:hypothetical protein
MQQFQIL